MRFQLGEPVGRLNQPLEFIEVHVVAANDNLGVQYQLTERLALRAGYKFNTNPVAEETATFQLSSGLLIHTPSVGFTYAVTPDFLLSGAYVRGFGETLQAPIISPLTNQPIAGTRIKVDLNEDSFVLGATIKY